MRSVAVGVAFAASTLASGTVTLAQSVAPGERVRLTLTSGESALTGTLREIRGDTLVLDRDTGTYGGRSWAVASEVKKVERSVGRQSQFGAGALTGALAGATIGAVIGFAAGSDVESSCPPSDPGCALIDEASKPALAGAGALTGGLIGLIVGSVIGSTMSTDRWQAVAVADHPVRIGLRAARVTGVHARVSFAFGSASRR